MVSLNIVTLPGKIDELRLFMQNRPIDIMALNETRLGPSIPDVDMEIDGYDLVRND